MTTVAQLLQRRRVTTAARRRKPPRAVPVAAVPTGIVRDYTRQLLNVVGELADATREVLRDEGVRLDAADGDGPLTATQRRSVGARLEALAGRIVGNKRLVAQLEAIGTSVTAFSRREWARQVRAALGVDLTGDPNLAAAMKTFRRENTALIKSMADDHVSRVRKVLAEGGGSTRVEVLAKRIAEETGVVKSRAALIARDQVLSLNAQVTEARHVAAGITEYVWRTSRDERVRPAHKALDGTRQKYAEPPIVDPRTSRRENPGQDFQCRCVAEPILPGIDDDA